MVSVIPPYYVRYVHTFTHRPMRKLWITCPAPVTCHGAPIRRPRGTARPSVRVLAGLRAAPPRNVPSPNAAVKVAAVVAGMVAGADSIDDLDRLRHGGMGRLFSGIRAPSTLGTFLRAFTFGHVRQLDKVAATRLVNLAGHTPLLRDADQICFVDVDDTVKPTYGYAKQGAGYGYTHVKGLNALIGTAVHADVGAGDRRDPAAEGLDQLPARRGVVRRRHLGHREAVRRGPGWWWPGWIRRSTPPTWSPRSAGPARGSPSPPG